MKSKNVRVFAVLAGVILLILGVLFFAIPLAVSSALLMFFNIGLIVSGFFCIITFFSMDSPAYQKGWLMTEGILKVLVGILLITHPRISLVSFGLIISMSALLENINRIVFSFQAKMFGIRK